MEPDERELAKRYWIRIEPAGTPFLFSYNHTFEGQQLRALKKQGGNTARATIQQADEEEDEEGQHEDIWILSPQRRISGRSSHHEDGTSTHHSDPQKMFSFTWDQRQTFIQELGNS